MSEKPNGEVEILLLYDDLLNFSKELEEPDKMATFAELRREFEERELLQEINADDQT